MIIKSHLKDYSVEMYGGYSFLDELSALSNKLVVADKKVYDLYKRQVFDRFAKEDIMLIEAVEDNKSIESALTICDRMTKLSAKRNANLVSFGGGIIQDMTGFTASVLYRGINWHYIPTTLLAQADSCLGSKTSLNYHNYKNLLGTFYPPNKIYLCPKFIETLSHDDFLSGMGEIVKFNIIASKDGLQKIEKDINALLDHDYVLLDEYIRRSHLFKKHFIEKDEFDCGVRKHLNFAHTFGHAVETISEYAVPHGQAVSVGMLAANRVSLGRAMLSLETYERIERLVMKIISVPVLPSYLDTATIVGVMQHDKKRQGHGLTAVLLNEDLKLSVVNDVTEDEVEYACRALVEKLL